MPRIFSNGPNKDFVLNPFKQLLIKAPAAYLAAPYFTMPDPILEAVRAGVAIQLIIGLNPATKPDAVAKLMGVPNLAVRYFTSRFHAKLYIFGGEEVLLGSSNLTDGGMVSNREAVIALDATADSDAVEEARALFAELWEAAQVLTPDKLTKFKNAWNAVAQKLPSPDTIIEEAVGKAEPININVASHTKTREQIFLQDLRRQVYEEYRPAFMEVASVLDGSSLRRADFVGHDLFTETNRFLNWVRLTYALGEEAWQNAPLRSKAERESMVRGLGALWRTTDNHKVPADYFDRLSKLRHVFGTAESIQLASEEELTQGLMGNHAFLEQLRFVKGGLEMLPKAFWSANGKDHAKVRRSLSHLLHGPGDFIERLHDQLYSAKWKLGYFGYFCALELFGTIKPGECPPLNGRMAKALRFLGHNVRPR